jgi:cytochrome c553
MMKSILMAGLSLLLLSACTEDTEAPPPVDIGAGRVLVETHCAECHGLDGRGQKEGIPNLAAQPAEYLADALSAYRDGRRQHEELLEMAANMSDADIANLAGFYAGLPPLQIIAPQVAAEVPGSAYDEGQEVAAVCTECHGAGGYSVEPGVPSLAGQQPAYLIVSTQEYLDGSRGHAGKEEMLQGLKQVDIERMAMYFAAQSPAVREAPSFGDPRRGESLSSACADCHGDRGISQDPLVPNLAGQEPVYLVNSIKSYRDNQRQHEAMVADSSDSEIEDIAAYYSVQHAQAAGGDEPGADLKLVAKCDRCHGPAVGQSRMVAPQLDGQDREYLVEVMKAYRDKDRGSSMMHKMSANYSDATIEALADYYATHPPQ